MNRMSPPRMSFLIMLQSYLIAFMVTCAAGEMSIPIGFLVERNFYNQIGARAGFSDSRILKGHPRVSLSYTTSRFHTLVNNNALKKDNFIFIAGWHFRPMRLIDPYIALDAGFTRFDREEDDIFAKLDNTGGLLEVRLGIESAFWKGRIHPSADLGYSIIASSTVFPLVFSLGVDFDIAKGVFK
jgi:hypothetical protein